MFCNKKHSFAFFFLDCCRENPQFHNNLPASPTYNLMGSANAISVMKFSCARLQLVSDFGKFDKSPETQRFISLFENRNSIETRALLSRLDYVFREWAIPENSWGNWIIFSAERTEITVIIVK